MTTSNSGGGPINYRMQATTTGNGFALASLLCSIFLFCLPGVGGLLGIVFGFLGMKRAKETNTGNGMAIGGMIIGIVSLIFWVIFGSIGGVGYFVGKKVITASVPARAAARQYVMDVSNGDVNAALADSSGIAKEEIAIHIDTLKPLGKFQDMTSNNFNMVNSDCTLTGVATFANGTKGYTIKLSGSGTSWKVYAVVFE